MKNIILTDLEKKCLCEMLDYGFAFDSGNKTFLCWGVESRQLAGALTSLQNKGVVSVQHDGGDVMVCCGAGYSIPDIVKISGYQN